MQVLLNLFHVPHNLVFLIPLNIILPPLRILCAFVFSFHIKLTVQKLVSTLTFPRYHTGLLTHI